MDESIQSLGMPREANDCAVRAMAVVTGFEYAACHKLLEKMVARVAGTGTWGLKQALEKLGYKFEPIGIKPGFPVWQTKYHVSNGKYLIYSSGHVMGMIDGRIVDWAQNRSLRVKSVWKLTYDPTQEL